MIKEWIAEYNPTNRNEETLSALREIGIREIALAGDYHVLIF